MWHGYGELAAPGEEPNTELDSLKAQVDAFQVANPNIKVDMTYVNSDDALEKLTVALQGDKAPDVTYQYGTNLPQLATSPKVGRPDRARRSRRLQLERLPGRRARRVHHRRQGDRCAALVDNLAVVYNKDLFAAAGLRRAEAGVDVGRARRRRKALTNASKTQFGLEWPDRRQRGHGSGSTSRCSGRPAATCSAPDN